VQAPILGGGRFAGSNKPTPKADKPKADKPGRVISLDN